MASIFIQYVLVYLVEASADIFEKCRAIAPDVLTVCISGNKKMKQESLTTFQCKLQRDTLNMFAANQARLFFLWI